MKNRFKSTINGLEMGLEIRQPTKGLKNAGYSCLVHVVFVRFLFCVNFKLFVGSITSIFGSVVTWGGRLDEIRLQA
jgi:hypothetical protein